MFPFGIALTHQSPNVSHGVKKQTELLIPVQLFILHENEKIAGDIIINEQISHRSEC